MINDYYHRLFFRWDKCHLNNKLFLAKTIVKPQEYYTYQVTIPCHRIKKYLSKIKIKNFGPIKQGCQNDDGWIDVKKITFFVTKIDMQNRQYFFLKDKNINTEAQRGEGAEVDYQKNIKFFRFKICGDRGKLVTSFFIVTQIQLVTISFVHKVCAILKELIYSPHHPPATEVKPPKRHASYSLFKKLYT